MAVIFFGRFFQFALALVMMRVMTSLLPPGEVGRLFLITSSTAFFALFLVNPVGMFVNRRLHAWEKLGNLKKYLKYYFIYLLLIALLSPQILIILQSFGLINLHTSYMWIYFLVSGSLLITTVNLTVIPALNAFGYINPFIGFTLASLISGFLFAISLIYSFGTFAEFWLLGLLAGQFFFGLIAYRYLFSKIKSFNSLYSFNFTQKGNHLRTLFNFAWPVSISVGLGWVQNQSYRFFIEDSMGLAILGLFVAGYGISVGIMSAFESILTTYYQPHFYRAVNAGNHKAQELAWKNYASIMLPALILMVFYIVLMAPDLTRVLLGKDYQSSSQFILWGALAEGFRVVANIYGLAAHAIMRTHLLLVANFLAALFFVILINWLMPIIGVLGAGISLAFSGLILVLLLHLTIGSNFNLTLPKIKLQETLLYIFLLAIFFYLFKFFTVFGNFWVSSFLLGVTGIIFLLMQYRILRDFEHEA
jgi:O-antigen/teichoic acid export membrane protein